MTFALITNKRFYTELKTLRILTNHIRILLQLPVFLQEKQLLHNISKSRIKNRCKTMVKKHYQGHFYLLKDCVKLIHILLGLSQQIQ